MKLLLILSVPIMFVIVLPVLWCKALDNAAKTITEFKKEKEKKEDEKKDEHITKRN